MSFYSLESLEKLETAFNQGKVIEVRLGIYDEYWTEVTVKDNIRKFLSLGYSLRIKPE